jgi:hypothetical protein
MFSGQWGTLSPGRGRLESQRKVTLAAICTWYWDSLAHSGCTLKQPVDNWKEAWRPSDIGQHLPGLSPDGCVFRAPQGVIVAQPGLEDISGVESTKTPQGEKGEAERSPRSFNIPHI